ncbi:hypothetical protein H0H87_000634, partial [Tephrocybe sp. NHM501043]
MGRFIQDNEDDAVEAKMVKVTGKNTVSKIPKATVKIVLNKQVIIQTKLCSGAKKWTLNHLPSGTSGAFTDNVVLLVKEKDIVDDVYGVGKYTVKGGNVWHGL